MRLVTSCHKQYESLSLTQTDTFFGDIRTGKMFQAVLKQKWVDKRASILQSYPPTFNITVIHPSLGVLY
jgi:cell division septal protein FtsQ